MTEIYLTERISWEDPESNREYVGPGAFDVEDKDDVERYLDRRFWSDEPPEEWDEDDHPEGTVYAPGDRR